MKSDNFVLLSNLIFCVESGSANSLLSDWKTYERQLELVTSVRRVGMFKGFLNRFRERETYHDIIESLFAALEAKDNYTSGHSERVAFMTYKLAKGMGIKGSELYRIDIAAHLHDIGKIGVPDKVLNKNGKLLPHEWEYIKKHPRMGYDILSRSKRLKDIGKIVLYHHERWDGKGYPEGLASVAIPIGSRIIAVCDAIDAMTSDRPYRKAMSFEECFSELKANMGLMFDPVVIQFIEDNLEETRCFLDPSFAAA